jgi:hypothetical protein
MSTMGGARRRGMSDLLRAVIEEAWRRARRRRLIYAGIVLLLAVIGAVVTATLRGGPSSSSSTPAAVASPGTPVSAVAVSAHKTRHHYRLYVGDTADVDGGPPFDWSCSYHRVGPGVRSLGYRVFECRDTGSPQPGAERQLRLRVVVALDAVFVERGHKKIFAAGR